MKTKIDETVTKTITITDDDLSENSGFRTTGDDFIFVDDMKIIVSGTGNGFGTAPNKPISNLGNEKNAYVDSKDSHTFEGGGTISAYREGCYYGTTTSANFDINSINSDFIRSLTSKTKKNYNAGIVTSSFAVNKGTTAIIIACPKKHLGPSEVLNTTNNSPMTELMGANNYKKIISVSSANDYDTKEYKVWVYKPDTGAYETKQTLKITLG